MYCTQYAPVALFVYNRPVHTRQVVDALQKNYLAGDSELIVFSDAPRDAGLSDGVEEVRRYIRSIQGYKKITVIERNYHFGLSRSIISGVTEVISKYGKVIVLEDDLVTSPCFLQFMNDALFLYENEEKVISVCGYMYPLSKKHVDTLFLRIADCWGWATWKRGWDLFVANGKELYNTLKDRKLLIKFNLDGAFNYTKMLKNQIQGKNDSWAVRWYASALLSEKLSLYPRQSLIMNIGQDGSGRHRGAMDYFKTELLNESIVVCKVPIFEDEIVIRGIESFLRRQRFNIGKRMLEFFSKIGYNKFFRIR